MDSSCAINPCRNGGSCSESGSTDFTCSCLDGFSGKRCEIAIGMSFFEKYVGGKCVGGVFQECGQGAELPSAKICGRIYYYKGDKSSWGSKLHAIPEEDY